MIAAALGVAPDDLPEPADRHDEGPGLTMVVSLLAAALAQCCAQNKVASGLVGTASDLKSLFRWHSQGQPEDRRPDLAQGWRREVCGATLLDVLSGQVALRVVEPQSDVPVALEPSPARAPVRDPEHDDPTEPAQ